MIREKRRGRNTECARSLDEEGRIYIYICVCLCRGKWGKREIKMATRKESDAEERKEN